MVGHASNEEGKISVAVFILAGSQTNEHDGRICYARNTYKASATVTQRPRTSLEEQMTDQSKDRIAGKIDDLKGRGKDAAGDLTGDEQLQAEGERDQLTGKLKEGLADLKDKADDFVKDLTGGNDDRNR